MLGPMQRPASSWRSTIIDLPAKEGLMTPNIDSIIRDHVTLTVRCLDRIYLQGYMPKLQRVSATSCAIISGIRFRRLRCFARRTTAL